MKTAEQWVDEILVLYNTPRYQSMKDILLDVLPQIQAEAIAHACRNVPPLPQLRVTDEQAAEIGKRHEASTPGEWGYFGEIIVGITTITAQSSGEDILLALNELDAPGEWTEARWLQYRADLKFCAASHQDLPDLLADRDTLLRLLHGSEGIEAYQKGYAAGVEAADRDYKDGWDECVKTYNLAPLTPEQKQAKDDEWDSLLG